MSNINQKCMIAALSSGLPRQSFKLSEEAEKIAKENQAESGTVKAAMNYFRMKDPEDPKGKREIDGLQPLKDFIAEYRQKFHQLARYPYMGDFYLAPAAGIDDLWKMKEVYEGAKKTAVWDKWANKEYDKWLTLAPQRMGQLYEKADFPSLSDCMYRFRVEMAILPLGDKEQVARIALIAPKTQSFLAQHADESSKKAVAELHKQIWEDLMKPLQHVVTTFEKDAPKVYETLLGNLMDIVSIVPNYSEMLQDNELASAAASIKEKLGKMTTDDLRKSDDARKMALSAAKELVGKYQPFARKFS